MASQETDRWQRLQVLFEGALACDAAERAAWLAAREPDQGLREEVMALIEADAAADRVPAVLQRAAADSLASPPVATRVGPWRLLDELGAGGMGTVFRAERADGAYQRTVAIKFLQGIATRDAAERMQRERQILADLDHPCIARLLDGGSTPEGQPYLVMEYVEGTDLASAGRALALEERLRLLQQVARAVHYAHQHLVVHRDLKPANILVRADGRPVLLDFGIARLVDVGAPDSQGQTRAWYTPGYASPEQRQGAAVGTASDVWSLGQILAELLSGRFVPPAADGSVLPPSARGLHGLPRRRLRELDAMVRHACAPEVAQRYPSAAALADDIDRWFEHRPLRAAPARPWYRLSTLLRRRRWALLAGVAALLALFAFTVRLSHERDRAVAAEALAREESATAEEVVQFLISLFRAAAPDQAGNRPIQPAELVDRGRGQLQDRLSRQPVQQSRLLMALGSIDMELGRTEQALASLRQALELQRALGQHERVVSSLIAIGALENQAERAAPALAAFSEALGLLEGGGDPGERIDALSGLAQAQLRLGQASEARESALAAVALAETTGTAGAPLLAMALQALAEVDSRSGRGGEAIAAARRALEVLRAALPPDHPDLATAIGYLANAHVQAEEYAQAERLFAEMLELRLRTLDPGSAWAITARHNLAHAIYVQGRHLEALPLMEENLALLRERGEDDTPSYLVALNNVASLHESTGNYPVSVALFQELVGKAEAGREQGDPRLPQYRQNLGRSLLLAGRLDEARPWLEHAIDGGAEPVATVTERGRRHLHLAEWLRRKGRHSGVAAELDRAEAVFGELFQPGHPRLAAVARVRGLLALDLGDPGRAVGLLRSAWSDLAAALGKEAPVVVETQVQLVAALLAAGRRSEAATRLAQAGRLAPRLFVPEAPVHAELARLREALAGQPGPR